MLCDEAWRWWWLSVSKHTVRAGCQLWQSRVEGGKNCECAVSKQKHFKSECNLGDKHTDKSLHLHSGDLFVTKNSFRATMQQNALWLLVVRCELKFVLHVGTTFCIFSIFDTRSRHSKMLSDKRPKKYVHTGLSMKWWAPNRLKKSVSVHYYILRTNSANSNNGEVQSI